MTSGCDINGNYDLTTATGLPASCSTMQTAAILVKQLENPDPDQRYAAISRLAKIRIRLTPADQSKIAKQIRIEKDRGVLIKLVEYAIANEIRQILPAVIGRLSQPNPPIILFAAIAKFGGRAALPFIRPIYQKSPTYDLAVLLLALGEPDAYLDNYAERDLELFSAPNEMMVYTDPEWYRVLGFSGFKVGTFFEARSGLNDDLLPPPAQVEGKPFATKMIPTPEAHLKPLAETNLKVLLAVYQRQRNPKVIPFVLKLAASPHTPIEYAELAETLRQCATRDSEPLLVQQLHDDRSAPAAKLVLNYFGERGDRQAVAAIASSLQHNRNYQIRVSAAAALGKFQTEAALSTLLGSLSSEEHIEVKAAVISALGGWKNHQAVIVNKLQNLIRQETNPSLIRPALAALEQLGGLEDKLLTDLLNNPRSGWQVKDLAAELALARGDLSAAERVIDSLYNQLDGTKTRLLHALLPHLSGQAKEKVERKLQTFLTHPSSQVVAIGLDLLRDVGSRDSLTLIEKKLSAKDKQVRFNAFWAFYALHDPADKLAVAIIAREWQRWQTESREEEQWIKAAYLQSITDPLTQALKQKGLLPAEAQEIALFPLPISTFLSQNPEILFYVSIQPALQEIAQYLAAKVESAPDNLSALGANSD